MSVYSEYKHGYIDKFDFDNYTDPCDYPDEPEEGGETMRLIDADALLHEIGEPKKSPWYNENYCGMFSTRKEAVEIIEDLCINDAPTVDAVEVTRCNACRFGYPRFWTSYGEYRCLRFRNDIFKGDHFCAWGEPSDLFCGIREAEE